MKGLRIKDMVEGGRGHHLAFDLRDILAALSEPDRRFLWVDDYHWKCEGLWCIFKPDEHDWDHVNENKSYEMTGEMLRNFASDVNQTIDGQFSAYSSNDPKNPIVIISAIDSSFWEVHSTKQVHLDRLKSAFKEVSEINNEEIYRRLDLSIKR